jgi:trimeric autotransporter adhesin
MPTLRGNNRRNRLRGTRKRDLIFGLAGNDILFGLVGADVLDGGRGNDVLDGGRGRDRLLGGLGNDIYVVDTIGDRVVERVGQGTDTVRSSISWVLTNNLENLELTGGAALNGTGNELNNVITGNDANNTLLGGGGNDGLFGRGGDDLLDGGAGADTLLGGAGNDTYLVDNPVDLVNEKAVTSEQQFISIGTALPSLPDAGGVDLVQASIDYILPTDVSINGAIENLELLGNADFAGTGNGLNNSIIGNSGINTLNGAGGDDALNGRAGNDFLLGDEGNDVVGGGAGDDILFGGTGFDAFLYVTGGAFFSGAAIGGDTIGDFTQGQDLIALSKATFGLNSAINDSLTAFGDFARVSSDSFASSSNALIVYSSQTGFVYFNPNRNAPGFGIPNAEAAFTFVLSSGGSFIPPLLTASNFLVVT